jgi:predicted DNA-binding protein
MSRADPQVNFRIPAELKAQLDSAAAKNKRSITAELVARLEESFSSDTHRIIRSAEAATKGPVPELEDLQLNLEIVLEQVKHLANARQK